MSAREIDMLHGTLWNKIIVFAIPLVLTGIFEQLFNAADTLILGRYDSAAAMAAVGNNTPLVGLIIYLFLGLSLGATVRTSSSRRRSAQAGCATPPAPSTPPSCSPFSPASPSPRSVSAPPRPSWTGSACRRKSCRSR